MGQLAQELVSQINPDARIVQDPSKCALQSEVMQLLGSNEKLKELTDWQSTYSFSEGIAETVEWFRNPDNLKAYKAGIYNI